MEVSVRVLVQIRLLNMSTSSTNDQADQVDPSVSNSTPSISDYFSPSSKPSTSKQPSNVVTSSSKHMGTTKRGKSAKNSGKSSAKKSRLTAEQIHQFQQQFEESGELQQQSEESGEESQNEAFPKKRKIGSSSRDDVPGSSNKKYRTKTANAVAKAVQDKVAQSQQKKSPSFALPVGSNEQVRQLQRVVNLLDDSQGKEGKKRKSDIKPWTPEDPEPMIHMTTNNPRKSPVKNVPKSWIRWKKEPIFSGQNIKIHAIDKLITCHYCDFSFPFERVSLDTLKKHVGSDRHKFFKGKYDTNSQLNKVQSQTLTESLQRGSRKKVGEAHAILPLVRDLLSNGISLNTFEKPENRIRQMFEKALRTLQCPNMLLPRHKLSMYIPEAEESELKMVIQEIGEKGTVSIIFDGTSDGQEVMLMGIRFVSHGVIKHRLLKLHLFDKGLDGNAIGYWLGSTMKSLLCDKGITVNYIIRDGIASNGVAIKKLNDSMPNVLQLPVDEYTDKTSYFGDIICVCHSINTRGKLLRDAVPLATKAVQHFGHLAKKSTLFKTEYAQKSSTKKNPPKNSKTRWHVDLPIMKVLSTEADVIVDILKNSNIGCKETSNDLLGVIQGSTGSSMELEIQLAALLDSMSDVAASVTVLEGDGFLAPIVTDIYNEHCRNKNSHDYNRLRIVLQKYSNELCREKASDRLYNEAMEDYEKKRMDAITTSMINVTEAHVQEEGMPQQGLLQSSRSKKATAAAKQFAEQQAEAAEKSQNAKTEKLRKKAKAAAQELLSMEPPKREDHVATEIPPELIQEVLRDHLHTWIKKFDNGIAKGEYDCVVRCKDTFDLFDACTFFNPYTVIEKTLNGTNLEELNNLYVKVTKHLRVFKNKPNLKDSAKKELYNKNALMPNYMQKCIDYVNNERKQKKFIDIGGKKFLHPECLLSFWNELMSTLPRLYEAAKDAMLAAPSSCAVERGFSIDDCLISTRKKKALSDYRSAAVCIRYNVQKRDREFRNLQISRKNTVNLVESSDSDSNDNDSDSND